jgi:hypothetical protein
MEVKEGNEVMVPKFYCSDYSHAKRLKNCVHQCEQCAQIVAETKAKKRETSDVTWYTSIKEKNL